ncbi:MAG: magnesium and cobalt transport protein CorA [Gammaproteobacteria bacterium]|nr:MAG: magnesium and cobalt transport protein CorA [Gammaproteobacteria bacterium]
MPDRELVFHVVNYTREGFEEHRYKTAVACLEAFSCPAITWLHVNGVATPAQVQRIGRALGLHPLALEDVLSSERPKADGYDEEYLVILRLPGFRDGEIEAQQVSLFLGANYVLSFFQGEEDPFEGIRDHLRRNAGRLRSRGPDFLFYALIDAVIDRGFPVLEALGEAVEDLEMELLETPGKGTLHRIHRLKRQLLYLRRFLWPQREVLNALIRDDHPLIQAETRLFLRDCYDHTVQIMDILESYRDMTAGMLDVYLSSISHRLNDIMRILTVFATLFIPLTFLTGIYGMNFDRQSPWNMPELGWYYGYPFFWALALGIAVGLLAFFKYKDWL